MDGKERRNAIIDILKGSSEPVSGTMLSQKLKVSRQVIVQDIALIKANDIEIYSTHKGYIIAGKKEISRVFKVIHEDNETEEELKLIVDMGGKVRDVFVYHKVYGVVRADMHIHSRRDISEYMKELAEGKSTFLKNVTAGYHYHTITADS